MSSWLDNVNFRITTDYVFEILNTTDSLFYEIWVENATNPVLKIAQEADTISERLDFNKGEFPSGGDGNYRVTNKNIIQILNTDTGLWHTLYIDGTASAPTFRISNIGEE